eukprot:scaffold3086_cov393-Prasinococcus_capsulatus_cf.AAC.5
MQIRPRSPQPGWPGPPPSRGPHADLGRMTRLGYFWARFRPWPHPGQPERETGGGRSVAGGGDPARDKRRPMPTLEAEIFTRWGLGFQDASQAHHPTTSPTPLWG